MPDGCYRASSVFSSHSLSTPCHARPPGFPLKMDSRLKLAGMTGGETAGWTEGTAGWTEGTTGWTEEATGRTEEGGGKDRGGGLSPVMPDVCNRASSVFSSHSLSTPCHARPPGFPLKMDSRLKLAGRTGGGTAGWTEGTTGWTEGTTGWTEEATGRTEEATGRTEEGGGKDRGGGLSPVMPDVCNRASSVFSSHSLSTPCHVRPPGFPLKMDSRLKLAGMTGGETAGWTEGTTGWTEEATGRTEEGGGKDRGGGLSPVMPDGCNRASSVFSSHSLSTPCHARPPGFPLKMDSRLKLAGMTGGETAGWTEGTTGWTEEATGRTEEGGGKDRGGGLSPVMPDGCNRASRVFSSHSLSTPCHARPPGFPLKMDSRLKLAGMTGGETAGWTEGTTGWTEGTTGWTEEATGRTGA